MIQQTNIIVPLGQESQVQTTTTTISSIKLDNKIDLDKEAGENIPGRVAINTYIIFDNSKLPWYKQHLVIDENQPFFKRYLFLIIETIITFILVIISIALFAWTGPENRLSIPDQSFAFVPVG